MNRSSDGRGPLRSAAFAVAFAALGVLAGCAAQSEMADVWHDTTLPPGSVRNVLVIAIRRDPVRRRAWEDAFVSALTARGVTATASYRLYQGAPPDTQEVIDAAVAHGYDAVLTSIRLPNETTSHHVPGAVRLEAVPAARPGFYSQFHSDWVRVEDPGYTETDTIIGIQTNVVAIAGGQDRLVWSGTLRTLESVAGGSIERSVKARIMPELERNGVVPPRVN